MKHPWSAYLIVAFISAVAGVAIAGTPSSAPTQSLIVVPSTTTTTTTTTTTVVSADETTTTTAESVSSEPPVESSTTTTSTTVDPPLDRADVVVVVVNGAGVAGLAGRTRDLLIVSGYPLAQAADGTTLVDETTIYFTDGFDREALALADDIELPTELVQPISDAPSFGAVDGQQIVLYLGRDRS